MYSERDKKGFTLLEVVISVAIIALIVFSIYRFVEGTLKAIRISTELSAEKASLHALSSMMRHQINNIQPGKRGALSGEPHKFNDMSSDEIQWICEAGNGLLTRNAVGEYKVRLMLVPGKDSNVMELGLRRTQLSGNSNSNNWIPVLKGVSGIEFRYFDPRLSVWQEKWSEPTVRPALVRMRIWQSKGDPPYEVILTLPKTNSPV